jgi:hypothetical protein
MVMVVNQQLKTHAKMLISWDIHTKTIHVEYRMEEINFLGITWYDNLIVFKNTSKLLLYQLVVDPFYGKFLMIFFHYGLYIVIL